MEAAEETAAARGGGGASSRGDNAVTAMAEPVGASTSGGAVGESGPSEVLDLGGAGGAVAPGCSGLRRQGAATAAAGWLQRSSGQLRWLKQPGRELSHHRNLYRSVNMSSSHFADCCSVLEKFY